MWVLLYMGEETISKINVKPYVSDHYVGDENFDMLASKEDDVLDEVFDRVSKMMNASPPYVRFAAKFDRRYIQRCYINFNQWVWQDGYKKEKMYCQLTAQSIQIVYTDRDVPQGVTFKLQLPVYSLYTMLRKQGVRLEELTKKRPIPIYELHFKKEEKRVYHLKFLARVRAVGETKPIEFERKEVIFREPNYNSVISKRVLKDGEETS